MYYDSIEQYQQLQKLKDKVDKGNLFNTLMTVKPTDIPIQGLWWTKKYINQLSLFIMKRFV